MAKGENPRAIPPTMEEVDLGKISEKNFPGITSIIRESTAKWLATGFTLFFALFITVVTCVIYDIGSLNQDHTAFLNWVEKIFPAFTAIFGSITGYYFSQSQNNN